jgi:hypothetical protein
MGKTTRMARIKKNIFEIFLFFNLFIPFWLALDLFYRTISKTYRNRLKKSINRIVGQDPVVRFMGQGSIKLKRGKDGPLPLLFCPDGER